MKNFHDRLCRRGALLFRRWLRHEKLHRQEKSDRKYFLSSFSKNTKLELMFSLVAEFLLREKNSMKGKSLMSRWLLRIDERETSAAINKSNKVLFMPRIGDIFFFLCFPKKKIEIFKQISNSTSLISTWIVAWRSALKTRWMFDDKRHR